MKCPTCGQICRNHREFCALCGTPLKQKRSHGGLVALIVILVLILGGLVAYQFYLKDRLPLRSEGQPAELVSYEELGSEAGEEAPKEALSALPAAEREVESGQPGTEKAVADGLLFADAAEIYALPTYTLALCRDGSVQLAGQSASPEFGFDLFDWKNIRQVVATDYFIAGLTEGGRVRLTGEVAGYEEAAQWTDVAKLSYDAGILLGLTGDGRVLAAGPELNYDPSELKDIVEIIPGHYDTLAVAADSRVFYLKRSGALWDAEGKRGLNSVAVGPDFVLYLMEDGTVVIGSMLWKTLTSYNLPTPSYYSWENIRQLEILDSLVVGLTGDRQVLAGSHIPDEPLPDTSGWKGVVRLVPDRERNIVFALTGDGRVLSSREEETEAVCAWENVVDLQVNRSWIAALTGDGRVLTWSFDPARPAPDTSGWTGVSAIALGERHLAALRTDGGVLAAGDNSCGQCG